MGAKGFWNETVRRVLQSTRDRAQSTAAQHPAAFAVLWLFKVLIVNVPVALTRWVASLFKDRPGRDIAPVQKGRV
jgi:hypothetical protein